jgi:hypothetical protein
LAPRIAERGYLSLKYSAGARPGAPLREAPEPDPLLVIVSAFDHPARATASGERVPVARV